MKNKQLTAEEQLALTALNMQFRGDKSLRNGFSIKETTENGVEISDGVIRVFVGDVRPNNPVFVDVSLNVPHLYHDEDGSCTTKVEPLIIDRRFSVDSSTNEVVIEKLKQMRGQLENYVDAQ